MLTSWVRRRRRAVVLDVVAVCASGAVAWLCASWSGEETGALRVSVAGVAALLYLKTLIFATVMSADLAMFVLALFQIMRDIRVLLVLLLAVCTLSGRAAAGGVGRGPSL